MTASGTLVLANGHVIDPHSGIDGVMDVVVADGSIAAIGLRERPASAQVLDCTDRYVTPGLIDSHSHVFSRVSKVGAPVDEAHLARGVVAVADAGTAGASTFPAFRSYVAEQTRMRVLSFLNVSVLGLIDFRFGELLNPGTLVPEDAIAVASANRDIVRGMKIRLSEDVVGDRCVELLKVAVATAGQAELPLMVHIGETAVPLSAILEVLRPGDIIAHCYTGKDYGILEDGKVSGAVLEARARGVLFECAHGKSNFSFRVAGPAIEQGFLPDFVCSDTSYRNWNGPVFDLLTTMSKLAALGMTLPEIIERATVRPASMLGIWDEGFGRIEVGGPAHLSVFERCSEVEELPDAAGNTLKAHRFEPACTVLAGDLIDPAPWRGTVPSAS